MRIEKDKLEYLEYNPVEKLLTIRWWTGGHEGAVNGLTFKVNCIKEHISEYKAPHIEIDLAACHDRW